MAKPFQFRLRTIFELTALAAALLLIVRMPENAPPEIYGIYGAMLGAIIARLAGCDAHDSILAAGAGILIGFAICLLMPAVQ